MYEFDGSNALKARHTHGPGTDDPLYTQTGAAQYFYYHKDGMGSVREITNGAGEVARRNDYDSFGNIVSVNGCPTAPEYPAAPGAACDGDGDAAFAPAHEFYFTYAYTGRQWDAETSLYHYRARYYDPHIGRFISEDPQWSPNLYAYVSNNPMNYTDSSGMKGKKNGGGNVISFIVGLTIALVAVVETSDDLKDQALKAFAKFLEIIYPYNRDIQYNKLLALSIHAYDNTHPHIFDKMTGEQIIDWGRNKVQMANPKFATFNSAVFVACIMVGSPGAITGPGSSILVAGKKAVTVGGKFVVKNLPVIGWALTGYSIINNFVECKESSYY